MKVAPYTGAWIEIEMRRIVMPVKTVAPYTGAWIEIDTRGRYGVEVKVAPYTGAWIEICVEQRRLFVESWSLPTRERGLK